MASENNKRRLAIIASKGTLDWAYPPFILASTASAMDMEVSIFFTFQDSNIYPEFLISMQLLYIDLPLPNI